MAARVLDQTSTLRFGVIDKALTLAHDLTSLGEFARERIANFIHDFESRRNVDLAKIALAKHRLGVLEKNGELLDKSKNSCFVHCVVPFVIAAFKLRFSTRACARSLF